MNQLQQVALTENDTTPTACPCGGELFDIAYHVRTLSHLSPKNPTGKDVWVEIKVFVCRACGVELTAGKV